ncbi:MAG TPA: hypothetical protein VI233_02935 [Puia sp.]
MIVQQPKVPKNFPRSQYLVHNLRIPEGNTSQLYGAADNLVYVGVTLPGAINDITLLVYF